MELVLYSTDHCSLCEEALELLFSMPELAGQSVRVVDVATDDALFSRYGERLPVLAVTSAVAATGAGAPHPRSLDWPFDGKAVRDLLQSISPA
mgnify:CR=1 FL=1